MKKIIFIISAFILITACSKDDVVEKQDPPAIPEIEIAIPTGGITIDKMQWLRISPTIGNGNESSFAWSMNGEVIDRTQELLHLFPKAGTYKLQLKVTNKVGESTKDITVVAKEATYKNGVAKVFEYLPAPGQFINTMPAATAKDDAESMRKKAEEALLEESMISLGGFGGYVVMGFDHTIVNREGNDFVVLGNAMVNSAEPGVIKVSVDANGNGLPDDEWYEIEGSEHAKKGTIKSYEITYFKPQEEPSAANEPNYIRWTDNQGKSGYIAKNSYHKQTYYPVWKSESMTLKGTFLEATIYDESGTGEMWKSPAYEFGYADNWPNTDKRAQIDIDWAVDKDGNKVMLKGIDFVKIHTANRAEGGHLGEVSTEVSGFTDLNLQ